GEIKQDVTLTLTVFQGKGDGLALAMSGMGRIESVTGDGLASWAVKEKPIEGGTERYLVLYPEFDSIKEGEKKNLSVGVGIRTEVPKSGRVSPLTIGPGEAVALAGVLEVIPDEVVDFEIHAHEGLAPILGTPAERRRRYQFNGAHSLDLSLLTRGAAPEAVQWKNARLRGQVLADGKTAAFTLEGEVVVDEDSGGSLRLLSGGAALSELPQLENTRLQMVVGSDGRAAYEGTFQGAGTWPVRMAFDVRITGEGARRSFDFHIPGSALTSMELSGLPSDVKFDPHCAVYPVEADEGWLGFLPADGHCQVAWNGAGEDEDSKLFFSTDAIIDHRVGAGLLRQAALLNVHVLQGRLNELTVLLDGPGEILAVEGSNLLNWKIEAGEGAQRRLVLGFSQALEGRNEIMIRSQLALDEFPVRVRTLRLTPDGAVRHAGHLRLVNEGAVRMELAAPQGVTQLAPSQFPGGVAIPEGRQAVVYRFPSPDYDFELLAEQILPEVQLSQILTYEMTETDRVLTAALELDIREAPLRDWTFGVPGDYAVVALTGAAVLDHNLADEVVDGRRALKVLFSEAVMGRQLIQLRLEKNEPATAGNWNWVLPTPEFPEAKNVRGHVGIVTAAGYRASPGTVEQLTEVPLSFFPSQRPGLQQAFRLRDSAWTATMVMESLGQTVQADVFHLYSLKAGMAYGSVLVNYFVGGSPVTEWRLAVPEAVGNVGIEGQHVSHWRREGSEVIVTLEQSILGPATVLLTFEQPMNVRGGTLAPGQIRPLNVQGERGYVQVVSPYQVQVDIAEKSAGLLDVEALELPAEFRLFSSAPTVAAYQYTSRPFQLELNTRWYEPAETIEQVVDYARLESQISRDGEAVTDARFFVKSRGRQALRLILPESVQLWDSRVSGVAVNARQDGDVTLIPLSATLDPNRLVEVRLRFGQENASARRPVVSAPRLQTHAMIVDWEVKSDVNRRLVPRGGTLGKMTREVRPRTGFEMLMSRLSPAHFGLMALLVLGGAFAFGARSRWRLCLSGLAILCAALLCGVLGFESAESARGHSRTLELVEPTLAA
ncbi:MAG: hypothetical protein AAF514_14180, partial [Verrucomicrobiota bacterium]